VLAVVEIGFLDIGSAGAAPQAAGGFEDMDGNAGGGQFDTGGKAGIAAADDGDWCGGGRGRGQ